MKRLLEILSYARPHASKCERKFIKRLLINPYRATPLGPSATPNYGIDVDMPDGTKSKTLFSCHTDTVHSKGKRQIPKYDADLNIIRAPNNSDPLGADNGAGIWLLLAMIDARVPGFYIFHRGEERGGIGSKWLADNDKKLIGQFDRAIAFDRRDDCSIITHQRSRRCCSDEFATALGKALDIQDALADDKLKYEHKLDTGGSFTDTASYTELIPECTNVSVGYMDEHSSREFLDVDYLMWLCEAAVRVQWEDLPVIRDPSKTEWLSTSSYSQGYTWKNRSNSSNIVTPSKSIIHPLDRSKKDDDTDFGEGTTLEFTTYAEVQKFVHSLPMVASDIMWSLLCMQGLELHDAVSDYECRVETAVLNYGPANITRIEKVLNPTPTTTPLALVELGTEQQQGDAAKAAAMLDTVSSVH
jgi:hypothetical protein